MFQKHESLRWVGREGPRRRVNGRRKEPLSEAPFMQSPKTINNQTAAKQLVERMVWAGGGVGEECTKRAAQVGAPLSVQEEP